LAQVFEVAARAPGRIRVGRLDIALVVAVLALLAAVAVPRQQDMSAAAHRREVDALAQSIRGAAQFAHDLWRNQGEPPVLALARGEVRIVNGYPAAADLALLLEEPEAMAFRQVGGAWQHRDRSAGRLCGVAYAPPAAGGGAPEVRLHLKSC
jgi:hypothetical protein